MVDLLLSTRRMFIMTYLCRSQYRSVFYFMCLYCDVCMSFYRVLPSSFGSFCFFYIAYTYKIESITLHSDRIGCDCMEIYAQILK